MVKRGAELSGATFGSNEALEIERSNRVGRSSGGSSSSGVMRVIRLEFWSKRA